MKMKINGFVHLARYYFIGHDIVSSEYIDAISMCMKIICSLSILKQDFTFVKTNLYLFPVIILIY